MLIEEDKEEGLKPTKYGLVFDMPVKKNTSIQVKLFLNGSVIS